MGARCEKKNPKGTLHSISPIFLPTPATFKVKRLFLEICLPTPATFKVKRLFLEICLPTPATFKVKR